MCSPAVAFCPLAAQWVLRKRADWRRVGAVACTKGSLKDGENCISGAIDRERKDIRERGVRAMLLPQPRAAPSRSRGAGAA